MVFPAVSSAIGNGPQRLPEIQILPPNSRGGGGSQEEGGELWRRGAPLEDDDPLSAGDSQASTSSCWKDLVLHISTTERLRYEDARRNEAEKLELSRQLGLLKREKETANSRHRTELEMRMRDLEKRNREAWLQLRRENTALEDGVRKAQTRADEQAMRRAELEMNVETLQRKAEKLEKECLRREQEAEREILRVKGERDASYRKTQDRAEQRVQAMHCLAKEAQDKMERHKDFLDLERRRLTVRADQLFLAAPVPRPFNETGELLH